MAIKTPRRNLFVLMENGTFHALSFVVGLETQSISSFQTQGLIQLKTQFALGRYSDRLASGQNLGTSTSRSTACGPNCSSFAAAGNGSD